MSYNGWKNYETWAVSLWLNNEEGTHVELRDILRRELDNYKAADIIKDWVNEMAPDMGATLWADLMMAALSEVDWVEIATDNRDGQEEDATDDDSWRDSPIV